MAATQSMPMPTFVARCLEEVGLEGRCGLSVRDMFALVDDAGDLVYRKYAWKVLRAMGGQVTFHYMLRRQEEDSQAKKHRPHLDETGPRKQFADADTGTCSGQKKRRRKWSTTLMPVDEGKGDHFNKTRLASGDELSDGQTSPRSRRRRRRLDSGAGEGISDGFEGDENGEAELEADVTNPAVGPEGTSGEHNMEIQFSERSSRSPRSDVFSSRSRNSSRSRSSTALSTSPSRSQGELQRSSEDTVVTALDERSKWLSRSPRGYDLGEELEVIGLSYEDAMCETPEGVLGIVACEELRLKYLGIVDPSAIDTTSPQFDLLELIGRAREQGLNAAVVAETGLFGDARKLHYLLDVLIASKLVTKNIISADQKRFNILHLTRFVSQFHPSMVSPTATLEKDGFPKDQIPHMIARILRSRGERTCVFADIGRELGFGKRHQEKLRKYFFHQMHLDADFPLELFMARCNTGSDTKGRKLWCVRLRSTGRTNNVVSRGENVGEMAGGTGPVIERGIMEQIFVNIHDRHEEGATIPEIRDVLGVPTFKLPYKLAQGLISNYNLGVEQVVLGKSTMYRMFAPGVVKPDQEVPSLEDDLVRTIADENDGAARKETGGKKDGEIIYQPSTLKEATRGLIVASTSERRRQYILERVAKERIVSVHQLRTGLIEAEKPKDKSTPDVGLIDIRSVRRIVDELAATNAIVTVDITLPPKRVLQKSPKIVKCVALPDAQRDRECLRAFIEGYLEDQHRKSLENLNHDNDAFIVVSNRLSKKMSKEGNQTAFLKENENREIVKYTAASYKLARVHLVTLHKQGRRLGMYFGIIYRCRALHLLLLDRVSTLHANRGHQTVLCATRAFDETAATSNGGDDKSLRKQQLLFSLKEVLDLLSVREYIQLVGVSELLSETEENKVRMAIARGDSWDALSQEIVEKIRGCEADRFSRLLRVLIELGLVQVVNESSHDLLDVMRRSSEDFDQVISQVAFATLSGGLFVLQDNARITLKRGSRILKVLPYKKAQVVAAGLSATNRTEQFAGRIPLEFALGKVEDAKDYWKALKLLSIEGGRLGSEDHDPNSANVDVDAEIVRPVPLRDHNLYALKVWVPRATTNYRAITERAKAAAAAVGNDQNGSLKRKRFQSANAVRVSGRAEKVQRRSLSQAVTSIYRKVEAEDGNESWRQMDGWGGARSHVRGAKWSSDEDVALMDLFIEMLSHQWFIDVPLTLQKRDERVAFRSTSLSRTRMSWKVLANKLGRKRADCILRVRELLTVPAIQDRVEKTKKAVTHARNPGGRFHEEIAVLKQPKLTALLCRALQIIFHERASYYAVLADMLISGHWREAEVKLVWRYLWLGSVITRTKINEGKKSKQRGFCMHSHVYEMTSLQIPHYSMEFFCDAAEYASFLHQNIEEVKMVEDDTNSEMRFEQEVEANAPSGQVAVDLAAIVSNEALYIPDFTPPSETPNNQSSGSKASFSPTLQDSKRSLAIKGFAGHLTKRFEGATPDDFLKDFWTVRAQYGKVEVRNEVAESNQVHVSQAFSTCKKRASPPLKRMNDPLVNKTAKLLLGVLDTAGRNGASVQELKDRLERESKGASCRSDVFDRAIDLLVSKRRCFEVNGSNAVRLVAASHAAMWTVKPYRISSSSAKDKVHFEFDQERSVVSRPWIHLDGSTNSTIALMLKRRVVNIVMCSPGIPDLSIHQKMHRALTLQDTRSLLDELIEEELIYARWSRSKASVKKPRNVFEVGTRDPRHISLSKWSSGQLRNVDNECDELFYFPSVNCVEILGAAATDMDLGRGDIQGAL